MMNLDIIVKPGKDGRITVACPNFPECDAESASIDEALETMMEKISRQVASNIKQDLMQHVKEIKKTISVNGPLNASMLITKLPISLN
jgi:predicted RNase H-like HicB family nuclease